jgi:membrane associated rhomboid family serine protease
MHIQGNASKSTVPVANGILIAVNVAFWLFASARNYWVGPGTGPLTILTYAFVHADFMHLLFNMWFLWVYGNPVNRRIGNYYYTLTYLGSVLVVGLVARLFCPGYCLGSSGGVFAIIGVAMLLMPSAKAEVHYLAFFPLTLIIGFIRPPKFWLFWFIRWGSTEIPTMALTLWFALLELTLFGLGMMFLSVDWTNLGHMLGFFCGIAAVLMLPPRISMRQGAFS